LQVERQQPGVEDDTQFEETAITAVILGSEEVLRAVRLVHVLHRSAALSMEIVQNSTRMRGSNMPQRVLCLNFPRSPNVRVRVAMDSSPYLNAWLGSPSSEYPPSLAWATSICAYAAISQTFRFQRDPPVPDENVCSPVRSPWEIVWLAGKARFVRRVIR
jgi:hypothetical protein